jgi:hypothetical protein
LAFVASSGLATCVVVLRPITFSSVNALKKSLRGGAHTKSPFGIRVLLVYISGGWNSLGSRSLSDTRHTCHSGMDPG